jgi:hypothetical protein
MKLPRSRLTTEERFWVKVKRGDDDACWVWQASCNGRGRGQFTKTSHPKPVFIEAHRMAYELTSGPIPEGMCVCHTCDNGICCNPSHLFLGTVADNNADTCAKGRQARGEKHGQSKLTEAQVIYIRNNYNKIPIDKMAKDFGVYRGSIIAAANGKTWGWLDIKPVRFDRSAWRLNMSQRKLKRGMQMDKQLQGDLITAVSALYKGVWESGTTAVFTDKEVKALDRIQALVEDKLTREPVCVIRGVDYYEGDTMMHRNITGVLADVVKDDLEALIVRRQDTGKEVTWLKHHVALYARADERTDG